MFIYTYLIYLFIFFIFTIFYFNKKQKIFKDFYYLSSLKLYI